MSGDGELIKANNVTDIGGKYRISVTCKSRAVSLECDEPICLLFVCVFVVYIFKHVHVTIQAYVYQYLVPITQGILN